MFLPTSMATILVLAALVALGPLSTDMYLPSLPRLTTLFDTTVDQVQITLSIFFIGFAVAQLIYGPLADRFGRKKIILSGMLIFTFASFGCATADTIEELILFRFLQAVGACGGPVLGRTMIRDIYGPTEAARVLSLLGTIMALAPAIAPIIGGQFLIFFDWNAIFIFLGVYGLIISVIFFLKINESLAPEHVNSLQPLKILGNFGELIKSRVFLGYTLCCSFIFSGLFCFLSGSSFVLIDFFNVKEEHYGYFFIFVSGGFMVGAQLVQRLASTLGSYKMLMLGTGMSATAGSAMLIASLAELHNVYWLVACQSIFMIGVGIVMPLTNAGAMAPFPKMAGTSSSLLGFSQSSIAAGVGLVIGHTQTGTPTVMAAGIGGMGILAFLSFMILIRPTLAKA